MDFKEILQQNAQSIQLNVFYDHFTKDAADRLDDYLVKYLESARTHLVESEDIDKAKPYLKILLEYAWEKLNTGIWQNVKDSYRYLYAYACYIDVLVDCRLYLQKRSPHTYQEIVKKCDLGILLGGPILEQQFNELINLINMHLKGDKDEESSTDLHSTKRRRLVPDEDNETAFEWMPVPVIDPNKEIERISCPSIEQFLTDYMKPKKPVILTGAIDHWPALQKWSFEYLIKIAGDRTVPIELGSRYSDDDWTQKLMTVGDFVRNYCLKRSPKCGYLAQHPLLDQIPDLKKDICIPDYCYLSTNDDEETEDVDVNAWIGPKQTISPLHNDPKQNLLAQVVGEKYIRLYDPIYSSRLYALDSSMLGNTSSIDVENPDYDRFPLFHGVPYSETILRPGDMLYMPARHWHYVRSLSPNEHISKISIPDDHLSISDMVEENLSNEDGNVNDEDLKQDLLDSPIVEETSSDENLNDELDFYDFLEVVSDQIDDITHEIEDRREDASHRHRLRRTIADLQRQRRLLKAQLQNRIHRWSENLKQPNFIRTRDKISFTIGVANACFSPLIAGRWPHILPLVYTMQALFLITLRFFIYKRKSWHYFVYDFCYFVNLLTLIYLWIFPSSTILFTVCYTLSHGPLALAIVLWRNSLVFHSLDKVTSLFIHMYPPLTLFTLRWLLPAHIQRERYPAIVQIGSSTPAKTTIFYSVVFYLIWQSLYYAFIVYGRREKVARGLRATSYTWLLADKDGFVARLVQKLAFGRATDGINRYKIVVYFFLQFAYMLLSILPVCFWYYRNMYINVIFLCSIFAVSVYNGASFYIDVFSRRYIKSLELLQDSDDDPIKNIAAAQASHESNVSKSSSDVVLNGSDTPFEIHKKKSS